MIPEKAHQAMGKIKFNDQDLQTEIIHRYSKGDGKYDHKVIAKDLGISELAVRNIINFNGIKLRIPIKNAQLQIELHHDYFDVIDTEGKAYWLGFLMADGHINKTHQVELTLRREDEEHLMKFAKAVNSGHKFHYREKHNNDTGFTSRTARIRFQSEWMTAALEKAGMTPRKKDGRPIPRLKKELQRHFWRGMVDADGTIMLTSCSPRGTRYPVWHIRLAGKLNSCKGLLEFLESNNIKTKNQPYQDHHDTWRVTLGGSNLPLKIGNLLYKDSTIYLNRKYQKYIEMVKELGG